MLQRNLSHAIHPTKIKTKEKKLSSINPFFFSTKHEAWVI